MFCTKCGKEMDVNAENCPSCGAGAEGAARGGSCACGRGRLKMFFDFDFNNFLTTTVVRVLYKLSVVFAVLLALSTFVGTFAAVRWWGILLAPIAAAFVSVAWLVLARLWCEMVIVIFKIADNTSALASGKK